jgi:hypothetical protein
MAHDDILRETFRMSNTARGISISIRIEMIREKKIVSFIASIFDIQGTDIAQLIAKSKQGEHTTEYKQSDIYLEKTIEPKVFMPFYTAPHVLPRKVEIER